MLRPGSWRAESHARFEREAEVLALLNHPSIAHVFEAGTADQGGERLPYLAMERVEGSGLLEWTSALDPRGRLELLECVANAVQHAHDQGVIHRDIKPSNILVTREGVSKVLDFGVARIERIERDERGGTTAMTSTGELIGTLQYMAPEQVSGEQGAVDERSDVYALGALAYEILGGRRPYDVSHLPVHKAAALILESEPTPLGRLLPAASGDVETIIAKAPEKDPRRRYSSAAEFGSDLRRHLVNLPIRARPATRRSRATKFVRRHRALVAGTGLVIAALMLGMAGMAWKAEQAEALATQSELRTERAVEVTNLLTAFFGSVNPSIEGPDAKISDMVARWEAVLDDPSRSPLVTAGLHSALSAAYLGIGDADSAERHQRDALELRESSGAEAWERADSLLGLGNILRIHGGSDLEVTRDLLVRGAAASEAAHGPDDPGTLGARASIAQFDWSYGDRSNVLTKMRDLLDRMLVAAPPGSTYAVEMRSALASTLADAGELAEAERLHLASLEEVRALVGDLHLRTAAARTPLVLLYTETNGVEKALEQALAIREIQLEKLPAEHPDAVYGLSQLGGAYIAVGRPDEAIEVLNEAAELMRQLSPEPGRPLIGILQSLVVPLLEQGQIDEASTAIEELAEIATPENGATLESRARVFEAQGILSSWKNDMDGALELQSKANALRPSDPGTSRLDLADALYNEGTLLRRVGRNEEALGPLRESYRLELELRGADHPYTAQAAFDICLVLQNLGRCEESLPMAIACYEGYLESAGLPDHATLEAARNLLTLSLKLREFETARELLQVYVEHAPDGELKRERLPLYQARLLLGDGKPLEALELVRPEFDKYLAAGRYADPGGNALAASEMLVEGYTATGNDEELAALEAILAAELDQ